MLTVGSHIEGHCVDLDFQGQGVIKHDGYVIFVKGLLEEEVAVIEITQLKKQFAEGKIIKLLKPSLQRVSDVSHLGSLDLKHVYPIKQLDWQIKTTKETIRKVAKMDVKVDHIITDNQTNHYRNKTVYHVMPQSFLKLGLYDDKHQLVPVDHFVLADKKTNDILKMISGWQIRVDSNILKHVAIRTNPKGEALVTLVATQSKFQGLEQLLEHLKTIEDLSGITLNIKDQPTHILGSKSYTLFGDNRIIEPILGYDIPINDRSFFQTNYPVMLMAYHYIKAHLPKGLSIIDAYSGVGSIGFFLSDVASKIQMIESNIENIQVAQEVIETYGLNHIEVIHGQAEKVVSSLEADVLIVDPPRNGLMPELVFSMIEKPFKHLVYMSCDVKTLSRDLGLLQTAYSVEEVIPIKMFFHTTEMETLCFLKRK